MFLISLIIYISLFIFLLQFRIPKFTDNSAISPRYRSNLLRIIKCGYTIDICDFIHILDFYKDSECEGIPIITR